MDTVDDIAYQMYLGDLAALEDRYHTATRDVLASAIWCERLGIRVIARVLGLQRPEADWFSSIVMERESLSSVAGILSKLAAETTTPPIPASLPSHLSAVARMRNRLAHENGEFHPEIEELELTDAHGQSTLFTLADIEREASEARKAAEELGQLLQ
jgi:hypothetical protein